MEVSVRQRISTGPGPRETTGTQVVRNDGSEKVTFQLNLITQFGSGKSVFQTEGTARTKPLSTASAQPGAPESERPVQVGLAGMREILGEEAAAGSCSSS